MRQFKRTQCSSSVITVFVIFIAKVNSLKNNDTLIASHNAINFRKCCDYDQRLIWRKVNSTNSAGEEKFFISYNCTKIHYGYDPQTVSLQSWNPALYHNVDDSFDKHFDLRNLTGTGRQFKYETGFPTGCKSPSSLDNAKDIWFKILETGEVFIGLKFWFRPVWLPVHREVSETQGQPYCVDEVDIIDPDDDEEDEDSHAIYHANQILLYCSIDRFDEYLFHRILFGTLCVTASSIILLLLIIYLLIWDKQNLAGWTQFNIFVAVFFVFGMEGVRTLVDYDGLKVETTISCQVIAAIAQYFFFALNTTWCVMNFDLFWTFWKLESNMKGTKGQGTRIMAYLTFSWGLPLLILFAFGYKHFEANGSKKTMSGVYSEAHRRCSSPMRDFGFKTQGVMFFCNVIFFLCTAFMIWKHRRGIGNNRRNSRNERHTWRSHAIFGRVILFAKLLVVMGVSSLTIPLDYFFGSKDPLNPFEVIFRMVHFIPVIAILFIFGFNEKNLRFLRMKYPNIGNMIPMSIMGRKHGGTDTNGSRSGQNNSTEIR